jgi:hypothetical protein
MPDNRDVAIVDATYLASTGTVVGYLQPHQMRRRIALMAVVGPRNSTLQIFEGYNPAGVGACLTSISPADFRTYDTDAGDSPIGVWPSQALTFIWSRGATTVGATARATVTSRLELT